MVPIDPKVSDYPQGWYHVRVDNPHGRTTAVVDIAKLAGILPHGSGIDSDWVVIVKRNGDVLIRGQYQAMNERGYCGWRNFRFTIARCRKNEYHALTGICVGQWQVTKLKGRAYLQSFVGGGDAKDYLYDVCSCTLGDSLDIHAIDSEIAHSEWAAQTMEFGSK